MATNPKPSAILGLNTAHPDFGSLHRFYEIGLLNRELVTDTALTMANTEFINDPDIGPARSFVGAPALSTLAPALSVPTDSTVILICAGRGTRIAGTSSVQFLYAFTSSNKVALTYNYGSGGRFQFQYEGSNAGESALWSSNVFASDLQFLTGHFVAVDYTAEGPRTVCINGVMQTTSESTVSGALSPDPHTVPLMSAIGSTANFSVGAIAVFHPALSTARKQAVTTQPWLLLRQPPAITNFDGDNVIYRGQTDVQINMTDSPPTVSAFNYVRLDGRDMLNLRWNGGNPLFDVPADMELGDVTTKQLSYEP